jgi:hypothetical protein
MLLHNSKRMYGGMEHDWKSEQHYREGRERYGESGEYTLEGYECRGSWSAPMMRPGLVNKKFV